MRTVIACLHCGKPCDEVQRNLYFCLSCPKGVRETLLFLFMQIERIDSFPRRND